MLGSKESEDLLNTTVPPSPFYLGSRGMTSTRDVKNSCHESILGMLEASVPCLCHSLPRLSSSASRGSPRDPGARGSAPAAPHTARLMECSRIFLWSRFRYFCGQPFSIQLLADVSDDTWCPSPRSIRSSNPTQNRENIIFGHIYKNFTFCSTCFIKINILWY